MSADDAIYRVQFKTEQHYYDLYVSHVFPADMAGFICLEGFLFHEETQVLIDPRVEKLTAEFGDVSTASCLITKSSASTKSSVKGKAASKMHTAAAIPKSSPSHQCCKAPPQARVQPCPCRRLYKLLPTKKGRHNAFLFRLAVKIISSPVQPVWLRQPEPRPRR